MQLPKFQSADRAFSLLQTQWAQFINPVLSLPMVQQNTLTNIALKTSPVNNFVNHGLGRPLQGWIITRIRGAATVYDTQDANPTPSINLSLVTSAPVTVDLVVF